MKIVVASDSHRNYQALADIVTAENDADLFLHAGDFQTDLTYLSGFLAVRGNNDLWIDVPQQRILTCEGIKIWLVHSDQYSSYNRLEALYKKAREEGYQIVCFGHTHTPYLEKRSAVWLVNPGSLWYNRDGSPVGYVVINIAAGKILAVKRQLYGKN